MRLLALLIGVTIMVRTAGAQRTDVPGAISVCDLLRDPSKYNRKTVSITGIYFPGGHGLYLKGDNCEGVLVTKEFKWPSLVWLPVGDQDFRDRGLNSERLRRALDATGVMLNREAARNDKDAKVSKVIVTYRGLLETRDNFDQEVGRGPDGTWVGNGFGPGASAPAQLFIDSVENVKVEFENNPPKQP
jgi:hypothetical protein